MLTSTSLGYCGAVLAILGTAESRAQDAAGRKSTREALQPHMSKVLPQGFNVAFMDGAMSFMSNRIDPATFAAMLTRAGSGMVDLEC